MSFFYANPYCIFATYKFMYTAKGNIWLEGDKGAFMGIGRMILLEKIIELGSITAAAKSMRMSYRQAWELISSMNKQAKTPLVETAAGGKGGGGTVVTAEGKKAIKQYKEMLNRFEKFMSNETQRLTT